MDIQSRHYCPNCRAPYDVWKSKLKSGSAKTIKRKDILEMDRLDIKLLQVQHACPACKHVYIGLVVVAIDLKENTLFMEVKQPDFGPVLQQVVDIREQLEQSILVNRI